MRRNVQILRQLARSRYRGDVIFCVGLSAK
jgi:hypothetical protein